VLSVSFPALVGVFFFFRGPPLALGLFGSVYYHSFGRHFFRLMSPFISLFSYLTEQAHRRVSPLLFLVDKTLRNLRLSRDF